MDSESAEKKFIDWFEQIMDQDFLQLMIKNALKIVLILVLTLVAWKAIKYSVGRWKKYLRHKYTQDPDYTLESEKRLETLTSLASKGLKIGLLITSFLVMLQTVGVSIGPLLASAGVLGIAVGFGAQNLVQDVISGFFILFEDQIRKDDIVMINGTGGVVEEINFRTVILRDLEGVVHIFRNGKIDTVANRTKIWSAMVFDIGVAYKEDLNKVYQTIRDVCTQMREDPEFAPHILEDIELFGVDAFGDSAVVVKARIKTRPAKQWDVGREYRKRLKEEFDRRGIEIPFPHLSLYFGEASKPLALKLEQARRDSST